MTKLTKSTPAAMAVNDLEETSAMWAGPDHQRLVSACPLDVANELGKIALAHPVGIVRMSHELLDRYARNLILEFRSPHCGFSLGLCLDA